MMTIWGALGVFSALSCAQEAVVKETSYRQLTAEEEWVIVQKGTERPYTGQYVNWSEEGRYHCKRCDAVLYESTDKFDSHCGWPSFDDEVPGAVVRRRDADGHRTEILCAQCGAHLGHVFEGEGVTDKNVRHCVNSISLVFEPVSDEATAYFSGGCFWGVEHLFQQKAGVVSAVSGYMGGTQDNPSYEDVVRRNTGHLETVEVRYDPAVVSYEALVKYFFEIHDPTQQDGQGPDIGEQYRSAVFVANRQEEETVRKVMGILKSKGYALATEVRPQKTFWKAEDYHQDYYVRKGTQPYCHVWHKRFD